MAPLVWSRRIQNTCCTIKQKFYRFRNIEELPYHYKAIMKKKPDRMLPNGISGISQGKSVRALQYAERRTNGSTKTTIVGFRGTVVPSPRVRVWGRCGCPRYIPPPFVRGCSQCA